MDNFGERRVGLAKDSPETRTQISDADCLLTGFGVKVDKEFIDMTKNLKYIGALATGYGNIDVAYAKMRDIVVTNVPGYSTESVAEFVLAVILERIRDLSKARAAANDGAYSEAGFSATEIRNKIFGVLGLGKIGSRVAELALGFGADVRYWSRNRKAALETKGAKYEDIEKLISTADFISIDLALNKETEGFLNKERIAKAKSGAIIVNTAGMELVDIGAIEDRLKQNSITFILDHSDEMELPVLKRLKQYSGCIVYPPIAYISDEARIEKQKIFIDNIKSFLEGSPKNKVN